MKPDPPLASIFIGTSLDGFIARGDGALDFYHPAVASHTATTSSWRRLMRWSSGGKRSRRS